VFVFPFLFFLLANLLMIPLEEKSMEQMMGQQFIEYRQRVGRWL
jgi:protein-S-isoprenylcysteine O-methyltransferase Ste14